MPPKKGAGGGKKGKGGGGGKAAQKAAQKVAEDKTFGLKNKNKSKKVQRFVQQVQNQANSKVNRGPSEAEMRKKRKEEERAHKEFVASLSQQVIVQPKVPFGVDPKSILCEFFKAGQCAKGKKCKFSHNKNVESKSARPDLYTDQRDDDTMDKWDDDKLAKVIKQKHGAEKSNATTIVCKYFLDAVENTKYGWFWKCPSGPTCKYRHALPPGFVLKSKASALEDDVEKVILEDEIEAERAKLKAHTPVTLESFLAWKKRKDERKRKAEAAAASVKRESAGAKKGRKLLSGRALFEFNPELFADEDGNESSQAGASAQPESEQRSATKDPETAKPADNSAPPAGGLLADFEVDTSLFSDSEDLPSDNDDK